MSSAWVLSMGSMPVITGGVIIVWSDNLVEQVVFSILTILIAAFCIWRALTISRETRTRQDNVASDE